MKKVTRQDVKDIVVILLGCAIGSAGFSFFTYPNDIVSGGLTGISQIINRLTGLPVGGMVIVMNIPLFLVAWKKFGIRFILGSLLGMLASSIFIDLFNSLNIVVTTDMLLAAVYGGIVKGFGWGLVYTTGATGGGSDIAARFLRRKYPYINFGTLSLGLDALVVFAFAVVFRKYDSAMYTIITMFVSSKVVNLLLYGAMNSSVCYIITNQYQRIADAVNKQLLRGATLLKAQGAYTGEDRCVVLCVIKRNQIAELKKIVTEIDAHAFVIVTESHEVFGKNFSDIARQD